jgi:hypothetical protein
MRCKPWTQKDDEHLRALVAQGALVIKAAAALKRNMTAVRARASSIGCPFSPLRVVRKKWTVESENGRRAG